MQKALCFLFVLGLAACTQSGGGMQQSGLPSVPASAGRTVENTAIATSSTAWNVSAGGSTRAFALQVLDFYPNAITINAGDTITWNVASPAGGDAHTITFLGGRPLPSPEDPTDVVPAGGSSYDGTQFTNSGIKFGGQTYTLKFPKAGVYPYYCLFHEPAMEGTVVVQNAGTPYPHNAQFYLNAGASDRWSDLGAAQLSVPQFPFKSFGTTLAAGIAPGLFSHPPSQATVLRFLSSGNINFLQTGGNRTIKVGTTLTFVNESNNEPHTVTVVPAGQHALPNIPTDPASGGTVFDGSHLVNSGTFLPGQSFSLKFTKAGTFFYGCLYHANSRMTGTITVTP